MARRKCINYHPVVAVFAERVRVERKRRGMSQLALAQKAQVNVGFVGKLERAETAPSVDTAGRLADALGVSPDRLLAGGKSTSRPLPVVREQIQRHLKRLLGREDTQALESLSVILGLVDNALARRNA